MKKILIVGDVHWSTYSSILRTRGLKCSIRLERLISSLNWCEQLAIEKGCDSVLYLGDFFDKPELYGEEITMLNSIKWNSLPHYFIVGNHESDVASLEYNSTEVLRKNNFEIINKPTIMDNIVILPYITEDARLPLKDYLQGTNKPIVFSHNDLKGIRYGKYESKTGFELSEIEDLTSLYINGHLHNGAWVTKKILNLGVLCGQNFGEDAFNYEHQVMVLDVDTLSYELIENPHAINFYKIEINTREDFNCIKNIKNYAVISIKCANSLKEEVKEILDKDPRILTYKLVIYIDSKDETTSETQVELKGLDYIDRFKEFIVDNMGNDEIVMEELEEVCK